VLHLTDLRSALTPAYRAKNGTDPASTEPMAAGVVIKATHLSEIRVFVRGLEQ
jgi:hypothetical protein